VIGPGGGGTLVQCQQEYRFARSIGAILPVCNGYVSHSLTLSSNNLLTSSVTLRI